MKSDDLFTAPQVAKICSTDLKTIHNWVNKGEIRSFRTPGRHLRFRREDVLEFLARYGYPVPDGFAPVRLRAVIIDSKESVAQPIARVLHGEMDVESYTDHFHALLQIGRMRPSLVLVNCSSGPDMLKVVENIVIAEKDLPVLLYGESEHGATVASGSASVEYVKETDPGKVSEVVTLMVRSRLRSAS